VRILNRRHRHLQSLSNTLTQHYTELDHLESRGKRVVEKVREIEDDTGDFSKELGKLEVMIAERQKLKIRKEEIAVQLNDLEVVANLLKDSGIKTQIVKKYIPVMNKLIRTYLTELDLPVHFKLDQEFNETVASPLHQDFSYASFSEGQKARIDLALMFTWREIGKLKNSVSTNILILDEVFSSSLDETGKELLLAFLRYKLDDNQNVLVVDHTLSGEFKSKFNRTIEVNRIKGFSQYS
jgi:DNA repair exonuclease SbcCD ATPase subunit